MTELTFDPVVCFGSRYGHRNDRSRRAIPLPSVGILQLIGCIFVPSGVDKFVEILQIRIRESWNAGSHSPVLYGMLLKQRPFADFEASLRDSTDEQSKPIARAMVQNFVTSDYDLVQKFAGILTVWSEEASCVHGTLEDASIWSRGPDFLHALLILGTFID